MVDRFADVMQKTRAFRKPYVDTALSCEEPAKLGDFNGMLQGVLAE